MNKSLIDVMLTRKSVRTYANKQLSSEQLSAIKNYLANRDNYASVFGSAIRIELLEHGNVDTRNAIKNAPVYVVVVIKNDHQSLIDAGFIFERFVLFIEQLGLATCYLNSGFQRASVQLAQPLKADEVMVLASPIGFASDRKSFIEKGGRLFLRAGKRKPIDQIFYQNEINKPIENDDIRKKLEYVRWAPSAVNAQPWRIVLDNQKAHFYINKKEVDQKRGDFNIHILDIGIAICHYALVFDKNKFYVDETAKTYPEMTYMITVQ